MSKLQQSMGLLLKAQQEPTTKFREVERAVKITRASIPTYPVCKFFSISILPSQLFQRNGMRVCSINLLVPPSLPWKTIGVTRCSLSEFDEGVFVPPIKGFSSSPSFNCAKCCFLVLEFGSFLIY
ncbi:hypothetical protein CEXT_609751 [Caerostris extrusa]|uniref:Uncharacterized protein n=1 Tax=Caerostris extrusa TaxID=172846 RepID=A0AAV4RJZ5_CAEEX|nr:hypothetical protein CEXT_609751 [Caerostris extrusa]